MMSLGSDPKSTCLGLHRPQHLSHPIGPAEGPLSLGPFMRIYEHIVAGVAGCWVSSPEKEARGSRADQIRVSRVPQLGSPGTQECRGPEELWPGHICRLSLTWAPSSSDSSKPTGRWSHVWPKPARATTDLRECSLKGTSGVFES